MLSRGFNIGDASRETVQSFRAHVPEKALPAFDKGVQAFTGSYPEAEASLKTRSIRILIAPPSSRISQPCRAVGNDQQASGAWQTASSTAQSSRSIAGSQAHCCGRVIWNRAQHAGRSRLKWPTAGSHVQGVGLRDARYPDAMRARASSRGTQRRRGFTVHGRGGSISSIRPACRWPPADDLKLAKSYADAQGQRPASRAREAVGRISREQEELLVPSASPRDS